MLVFVFSVLRAESLCVVSVAHAGKLGRPALLANSSSRCPPTWRLEVKCTTCWLPSTCKAWHRTQFQRGGRNWCLLWEVLGKAIFISKEVAIIAEVIMVTAHFYCLQMGYDDWNYMSISAASLNSWSKPAIAPFSLLVSEDNQIQGRDAVKLGFAFTCSQAHSWLTRGQLWDSCCFFANHFTPCCTTDETSLPRLVRMNFVSSDALTVHRGKSHFEFQIY